ncbi:MAG: CBS domain-containing protein [Betaproteobacteria bacterium]|nr:CBS domain-containing protein [Betaproteobacteria bacterium]MDH5222168.1 CBS domain-containing protein [Betaproteobacteria bacterium]MDH5350980.1 CBS domain-containing protein [Betaproteobacteria bacterium]
MAIGELCSREAVFVKLNESCALAAQLMREQHVGSLVVVREQSGRRVPAGMITDRDLVVGVMALGLDPEKTLVEAVMRPEVAMVREDEGVGRAIALMREHGARRLPVVDAGGALVGVLAADDLIELFGEELAGLAEVIGKGPRRERATRRAAL